MDGPLATGVIAVILKGYPRLSETFIAQELHALEGRGIELALFSMRRPTDREAHPIHAEIRAPVVYLPEYLHQEPRRVWRAWRTKFNLHPPLGLNLLLASYRFKKSVWEVTLATLPFLAVLVLGVLLITYVEPLTMVLVSFFQ